MFNVQQITSRLAELSDAQLAQYARMHKDDPYILPLASSEFKRRQQLRQSGRMQQGGPKPTVADQEVAIMNQYTLPEEQGIGVLPEQSLAQMADGGIAGYAEGGPVSFAAGGTKKGEKFNPDAYLQDPNVQKFLQYLNVYEGKPQANHLVGFKKFEGFDKHPHTPVVFNKKGATSDAAGLFQIKGDTWEYQSKKLGLKDFSPENQKRAAVGILKDIGALSDIVQGNFEAAKKKATRQWASIPGSTIGKATGQIPRYKEEAEKILEQPTQEAQNQPAQPKERTLGQRLFDVLPFSKAGAANPAPANKQTFSAIPPIDEEFYTRLEAARADYQKKYGKDLPVTSLGRTRYEQQGLSSKKQRGGPGSEKIFTPVNPANYPGREVFHMNAVDVSSSVPEAFMRKHGLYRPDPKGDPVHYVAIKDWKPTEDNRTTTARTDKQTPARVEQSTPSTYQQPVPVAQNRNAKTDSGIAAIIPSAQAAEVNAPAQPPVVRNTSPRAQTPSANTVVAQTNPPAPAPAPVPAPVPVPAPAPAPKAVSKAADRDDVVYSPETGLPIFGGVAYGKGENDPYTSKDQALALGTGAADVILGIPEGLLNLAMRNFYNLPFGTQYTWEQAAQAAADNPVVKAAGVLRSGTWFGVENDPAYRKDPLSVITSLPSLGVQGIAKKFGINEEAAQLALDNALVIVPFLGKAKSGKWQVQDNMPKKKPAEVPTAEGIAQLRTEAEAAQNKTAAPRLVAPEPNRAVEVTPSGAAKLPKPAEFVSSEAAGLRGLAEDRARADALTRRLQAAEDARAAAAKKGAPGAAEAFLAAHPWTAAGVKVAPYAALSGGTDFSTTSSQTTPEYSDAFLRSDAYPDEYTRGIKPRPDITPVDQAKRVAKQVTETAPPPQPPKTSGFSNEDILTMGLNMMMAPPGQSGGALSQLASNVGRSGIATLQARRDRAKLEADQAFRELYGKYIQKQTDVMGQEPPEIRTVRAFQKEPALLDTYKEMYEYRTSPAMLLKTYEEARTKAKLGFDEAWLLKNPDFQTWLRNSGYGDAAISPTVLQKMNLYK